jgi:hypothetical protein
MSEVRSQRLENKGQGAKLGRVYFLPREGKAAHLAQLLFLAPDL